MAKVNPGPERPQPTLTQAENQTMKDYTQEDLYCLQNMLLFNSYMRCYPFEYASAFDIEKHSEKTGFVIGLIDLLLQLKLIVPGHLDVQSLTEQDYALEIQHFVAQLRAQKVTFECVEASLCWWHWDLETTPLCDRLLKKYAIDALPADQLSQPFMDELSHLDNSHHHQKRGRQRRS